MREMRSSFGPSRMTPVVKTTLIVLVAAFVLVLIGLRFTPFGGPVYTLLRLDPALVVHEKRVWTLVTYALLHDISGPMHLLFNCLGLYFFGPELESRWGSRKFTAFLVLSALGGGLFILATWALGLGGAPTVGASAMVLGAVVAWGLIYPDRELYFFFVLRMRGVHVVYATIALELLNALSFSAVSAAGHFGGMAVGAGFALLSANGALRRVWLRFRLKRLEAQNAALKPSSGRRRADAPFRVIQGGRGEDPPKDKRWLN